MRRDPHETREEVLRDALAESMRRNGDPKKREERMDGFNERRGDAPGRRTEDVERALQAREIELLHVELNELRSEVNALKADREKALRWGISVLGTALIGMGSWIFSLFASNLPKGH